MPVTFKVAQHDANQLPPQANPCKHPVDLLVRIWGVKTNNTITRPQLLQTSLEKPDFGRIIPEHNGFVNTVIRAYNTHQHLVLRPDDVWIAILGQFNFYVNAHSKELRKQFVAHEDKKTLVVRADGDRFTVDFGSMARQMANLIDQNVVDKDLKDWILPDFSTTTYNDTVVCSVLMMATLKAYFEYVFCLTCGIPSVTLEGTKSDWTDLLKRVDKLDSFGEEPKAWASLLRPILKRFVSAFEGNPDISFWSKICHYEDYGSGSPSVSGWITAFCVWSSEGKWLGTPFSDSPGRRPMPASALQLDDVWYMEIDESTIPPAFCEVDVLLNDNGEEFKCMMVSGHMATRVVGKERNKVAPLPAWFMFIKDPKELKPSDLARGHIEWQEAVDENSSDSSDEAGDAKGQNEEDGKPQKVGSKLVKALRNSRLGRRLPKLTSPK